MYKIIRGANSIDWDSKGMKVFDWLLSFISIGYGLYAQDYIWIAVGILGMFFAYYRPISKIQKVVQNSVRKKIIKKNK